ncbi:MAG: metal-dependent hydrolase [Chromatiaceae bacterium]|nr:metal-dependent hydrolase [Chromatiaceae bacterium]
MANFQTHLNVGLFVSGAAVLGLHGAGLVTPAQTLPFFALGVAGSLLPDIDADNSRPVRMFFSLFGALAAFVVALPLVDRFLPLELVLIWGGVFLGVRYGVFEIFARLTVHRGIWHSWLALVAVALAIVDAAYWWMGVDARTAWGAGLMVGIGYLTHLVLDEIYSVDLLNSRVKRSFGTALKPFSLADPGSSFAMLVVVLALAWIAPEARVLEDWLAVFWPQSLGMVEALTAQAEVWRDALRQMLN